MRLQTYVHDVPVTVELGELDVHGVREIEDLREVWAQGLDMRQVAIGRHDFHDFAHRNWAAVIMEHKIGAWQMELE